MLTLSDASHDTKEILKWGGLFIAGIVILIILLRIVFVIKEAIFPTPPPKPTVSFGKLPPQVFPKNVSNQVFTYSINTLSGNLPTFQNLAEVFTIQTYTPDLLGLSRAKQMAAQAGFTRGQTKLSDTLYQWGDPDTSQITKQITMDTVTNYFSITSNYMSNSDFTSGQNLPSQNSAVNDAQNLLNSLNSMPPDIDQTKTQAILLSLKNGILIAATSVSDTQLVRVVFHQQDIDGIPIYYEKPDSSNIYVLVGSNDKILEANYIHQVPTSNFSTYPLKTAQQALADLQQGKGYIASYYGSSKNIAINNVFLAYYLSSQPQAYLMPIVVFEGDNGFVAYVPAITDGWINK